MYAEQEATIAIILKARSADIYMNPDFKKDKTFYLKLIQQNTGLGLSLAGVSFQGNREVVLAAVKQNGMALQYATPKLQGNRDVVLGAVNQSRVALNYLECRKTRRI